MFWYIVLAVFGILQLHGIWCIERVRKATKRRETLFAVELCLDAGHIPKKVYIGTTVYGEFFTAKVVCWDGYTATIDGGR